MINKILNTLCLILMTQLIGCGGRPISMAHYMTDENGGYVSYQKAIGNIKDEELLNSNGEYENSFENDWNMSAGGIFNIANSPLKLGVELGLNGLTTQFGYKDKKIGIMGWGTATYGFPCYGVQGAYSLVNNKLINFGPVIYYAS